MASSTASQPLVAIQPLEGDMSTDGSNTIPFPDVLKAASGNPRVPGGGTQRTGQEPFDCFKYGNIGSKESKPMPRGKDNEAPLEIRARRNPQVKRILESPSGGAMLFKTHKNCCARVELTEAVAYIPLTVLAVLASVLTYYQKAGLCKGYPSELLKWTFDWEYMVRGLVLDKKTSLILKVSYLSSLDYRLHRVNIRLYQTLFRVE
ncbi:hypothetical protein GIB67_011422 [Kingdonia uniflora]|uniref:Uncharacterized protein n=1 Tax=Kingdonia uniflora TaxID=39325 RepID=A0A7J7NLG0_9MAGN|nr:hypothetical protein GIB67_011422 [Kingdonia uniflora]